jgi:hypothetical protein
MGICEVEELQAVEDAYHSPPGHATRVSANSRPDL